MTDNNLVGNLLTTLASLVFVLGLAWLVLRLIQRMQDGRARQLEGQPDLPQVLHTVAIGPRERLVTVHYQGRTLLLGVTAASIQRLDLPHEH